MGEDGQKGQTAGLRAGAVELPTPPPEPPGGEVAFAAASDAAAAVAAAAVEAAEAAAAEAAGAAADGEAGGEKRKFIYVLLPFCVFPPEYICELNILIYRSIN